MAMATSFYTTYKTICATEGSLPMHSDSYPKIPKTWIFVSFCCFYTKDVESLD